MKKLKQLLSPYTIRERIGFASFGWTLFVILFILGSVLHRVFYCFAGIILVSVICYCWIAIRCKHCDAFLWRYIGDIQCCPYCRKHLK